MSTTEDHVRMLRTRMANEEAASAKDARRIDALEASVKALEQADRRTPVQRFFDEGEPKPSAVKAQLDERIDRLQNQVNAVAVEAHRRLCKLEPAAPGAVENPVENPPPPETPNPPTARPPEPPDEPPDDPWNPPATTLSAEIDSLRKRAALLEQAVEEHARALEWTQDRLRELRLGVARSGAR